MLKEDLAFVASDGMSKFLRDTYVLLQAIQKALGQCHDMAMAQDHLGEAFEKLDMHKHPFNSHLLRLSMDPNILTQQSKHSVQSVTSHES